MVRFVFTFHYGEIRTDVGLQRFLCCIRFTFHYGEIRTKDGSFDGYGSVSLHSTMVRLGHCHLANDRETFSFTFHYGEIRTLINH